MREFCGAVLASMCLIPGVLLRYTPFASVVNQKQKRTLLILDAIALVINTAIMAHILKVRGWNYTFLGIRNDGILFAAVMALINALVIRGRWKEHMFVFSVVLTCNYLLLSIPTYISSKVPGMDGFMRLALISVLYGLLLVATYAPMRLLLRKTVEPFLILDVDNYWGTIWFIPVGLCFGVVISLSLYSGVDTLNQVIGRALIALVLILICLNIASDHTKFQERQTLEAQLANQKLYYAQLQLKVEEARKSDHDFKHHIAAIRYFVDTEDMVSLRRYCDELTERRSSQMIVPNSGSAAVDSMLYHYMQLSERENVQFDFVGSARSSGIVDVDLCALLGNALDNAMAGCMTVKTGRRITVISQAEERLLSVIVRNSFDGNVWQSGKKLLSRKRRNGAGIGMSSMAAICERYGGKMETKWDEQTFTVMFLLPIEEEQAP